MNKIVSPDINTYTHIIDNSAIEVVLVGLKPSDLGTHNSKTPNNFNIDHISSWMKSNYNINKNKILAQVPRKIDNYPDKMKNALNINSPSLFLTYISITDDKVLKFYYPQENDKTIIVRWDIKEDSWCVRDNSMNDISIENMTDENKIWSS